MKFLRRFLLTVLVLLSLAMLFRGWIYRSLVTYRSAGTRVTYTVTDPALAAAVAACADGDNNPGVQQVLDDALQLTADKLYFRSSNTSGNPNELIRSQRAHCVGYAAFYAAVCNELFRKHAMQDNWVAQPQIGQLFLFDTNIHTYFQSTFFKDHDFVTIENKTTGEVFAVDPSLYDYLYVERVHFEK